MRALFAAAMMAALVAVRPAAAAEDVAARLDEARALYQKGETARAANTLQAVLMALYEGLGQKFMPMMPKPPQGWQPTEADVESLGVVGGGLTVTRGYQKGDAVVNATLILDNPAAMAATAMFADPALIAQQPGMSVVKIDGQDAILRWDAEARSGEIILMLGNRVLLQVDGSDIPSADVLVAMMKSWDLAAIRKLAGV